jgi:two-component system sensor histidine kinase MprB
MALAGPDRGATTDSSGKEPQDRILIVGKRNTTADGPRNVLFMQRTGPGPRPPGPTGPIKENPAHAQIVLPRGPLGIPELYAQIVAKDGAVTRPSDTMFLPATKRAALVAAGKEGSFFYETDVDGTPFRVYVTRLDKGHAIQVARPLAEVESTLDKLALVLAVVTLGGVGLAIGLGFFVSRAALAPVARLTETAEQIAESRNLAHRMEVVGNDELARLARSFNTTLSALEQSLDSQRQLVADASHELRTPLTSLKTNVEVLLRSEELSPEQHRELNRSLVLQIDEVVQLIGDLIDLARESESEEKVESLRLDELVEGVVRRVEHRSRDVRIELETERCDIEATPVGLERAVLNLLDNAVKWSPPGTVVEIRVSADGIVSVRDHGPGVSAADAEHIFDRFYRSPEARGLPGSGLGLAIVRQVAENHDGEVSVNQPESGGAEFRFDLSARAAVLT